MNSYTCIESLKKDLGVTEAIERSAPTLQDGQVLARIERFALSTNNISYAAYGQSLGFWNLFPATREGWGCMSVWGYAEIALSRTPEVAVGRRVFGFFPVASHVVLQPSRVTSRSFVDGAPHRTGTPKVYNLYEWQSGPFDAAMDSLIATYRPLFITSYTAADFLRDHDFFGAEQFVVSSASSKTAYGTAYCLDGLSVPRIALTSARNVDFVKRLGCYEQVHAYDELSAIAASKKTVYLDYASEDGLRRRVHEHFGAKLTYDALLGATQSGEFPDPASDLPGPKPEFFMASRQLDVYKDKGQAREFMARYEQDERRFMQHVHQQGWIRLDEHQGLRDAPAVIAQVNAGTADPAAGHIFVNP